MSTRLQDRPPVKFSHEEELQKYVLVDAEDQPYLWLETGDSHYVARWETEKGLAWFDDQLHRYVEDQDSDIAGRHVSALFEPDGEDNYRLEGMYDRIVSEDGFPVVCTYFKIDFVSYDVLWEAGEDKNHVTVSERPTRNPVFDPLQWFYSRSQPDREEATEEIEDVIDQIEEDL